MKYIKRHVNFVKEYLNDINSNMKEFIVYHSTYSEIDEFDFNKKELKPNSSTRIDGIFFSNIPQESWGENVYKVKLISENPAFFDISKSRFDSLGIQEAFDALLRGETSYMIEDLVEYGDMEHEEAEDLVNEWRDLDLIVITNQIYAKHTIEYIVPDKYYNGNSAKIVNLGKINEQSIIENKVMSNIDTLVSKNGKPIIMYHGGSYTDGEFKGNGWFTTSKSDAKYYAKQNGGTVIKAFLIVKNPLYSGHIEHLNIKITKDILTAAKKRNLNSIIVKNNIIQFIETNAAVLIAQDIGRDGVIDIENNEILDVVIFDNKQIILI